MAGDATIQRLHHGLPCHTCEEWLHLYVEGEADRSQARAIEIHLASCPACSARRRTLELERIRFLEMAVTAPALSSRFPSRVVEEIRRREIEDRQGRIVRRLGAVAMGIASIAALGIAALALGPYFSSDARREDGMARTGPMLRGPVAAEGDASVRTLACTLPLEDIAAPAGGAGEDGSVAGSASAVGAQAALPPILTAVGRLQLSDSIEFSASILKMEEKFPCTRDVNHDGETNVSDAAHLFMLAVAPTPSAPSPSAPSREEIDLDCYSTCKI